MIIHLRVLISSVGYFHYALHLHEELDKNQLQRTRMHLVHVDDDDDDDDVDDDLRQKRIPFG